MMLYLCTLLVGRVMDKQMEPEIKTSGEKKLVGKRLTMSLAGNRTSELWKSFLSGHKEIANKLTSDFISMTIYKPSYFAAFNSAAEFEKWAAVEVTDFESEPNDMEHFILPGGLYAVFNYKGSSADSRIFQYIFGTWLPNSDYLLDDRPHLEILGEKYKNNDPNSEEEIWIPVRKK
jgi:AraC family transcriptional regulator